MKNDSYKYGFLTVSFFVLAIIAFILGFKNVSNSFGSMSWPTVKGSIVSSSVGSRWNPAGVKGFDSYYPVIIYQYEVDGKTYKNSRVSFDRKSSNRRWAKQIVAQYPEGHTALIYYQGDDPQNSVLEPGASLSLQITASLIIFIFSSAAATFGLKRWRVYHSGIEP